jgi:hypothetical protein
MTVALITLSTSVIRFCRLPWPMAVTDCIVGGGTGVSPLIMGRRCPCHFSIQLNSQVLQYCHERLSF